MSAWLQCWLQHSRNFGKKSLSTWNPFVDCLAGRHLLTAKGVTKGALPDTPGSALHWWGWWISVEGASSAGLPQFRTVEIYSFQQSNSWFKKKGIQDLKCDMLSGYSIHPRRSISNWLTFYWVLTCIYSVLTRNKSVINMFELYMLWLWITCKKEHSWNLLCVKY